MPGFHRHANCLSRYLVPDFFNDVRSVIVTAIPERRSVTCHLQRRDAKLALSDPEAHQVSLRPPSFAVPAVIVILRWKQTGILLLDVYPRRRSETELFTVLRPDIQAGLQHQLIVINIARPLDR